MPTLHGFAFKYSNFSHPTTPALARPEHLHATALKPTRKAGRRGGGSIARQNNNYLTPLCQCTSNAIKLPDLSPLCADLFAPRVAYLRAS